MRPRTAILKALQVWIQPSSGPRHIWLGFLTDLARSGRARDFRSGRGSSQAPLVAWGRQKLPGAYDRLMVESFAIKFSTQNSDRTKALRSLQSAGRRFLEKAQPEKPYRRHVLLASTCEVDKSCQGVLAQTYAQPCNWPDILNFNSCSRKQWCSTHKKLCRVVKHRLKSHRLLPIPPLSARH